MVVHSILLTGFCRSSWAECAWKRSIFITFQKWSDSLKFSCKDASQLLSNARHLFLVRQAYIKTPQSLFVCGMKKFIKYLRINTIHIGVIQNVFWIADVSYHGEHFSLCYSSRLFLHPISLSDRFNERFPDQMDHFFWLNKSIHNKLTFLSLVHEIKCTSSSYHYI